MPFLPLRLAALLALLAACDWLTFPCPDGRLPMPRGTRPAPFKKTLKKTGRAGDNVHRRGPNYV